MRDRSPNHKVTEINLQIEQHSRVFFYCLLVCLFLFVCVLFSLFVCVGVFVYGVGIFLVCCCGFFVFFCGGFGVFFFWGGLYNFNLSYLLLIVVIAMASQISLHTKIYIYAQILNYSLHLCVYVCMRVDIN